jgi:hypothetical protein
VAAKSMAAAHRAFSIFMYDYLISFRRTAAGGEPETGNFGH